MYGISKLFEISYTFLLAREVESEGNKIFVNAMCPGYCATDMSSGRGNKSAAEGADTAIWLALHDLPSPHGKFITERSEIAW